MLFLFLYLTVFVVFLGNYIYVFQVRIETFYDLILDILGLLNICILTFKILMLFSIYQVYINCIKMIFLTSIINKFELNAIEKKLNKNL